jgi:hypothetical protein
MNSAIDSRRRGRFSSLSGQCRGGGQGWHHGGQGRAREPGLFRQKGHLTENGDDRMAVMEDLKRRIETLAAVPSGSTSVNPTDS